MRKWIVWGVTVILIGVGVGFAWWKIAHTEKSTLALQALSVLERAAQLLPIEQDTKEVLAAADTLSQGILKKDGIQRTYLILLQNNYELRPGGGFLGQYAVAKVQDGELTYLKVEDANLLDQRIKDAGVRVTPPWPLTRYAQIKRWMLRDSNFSPDFPTNASKAEYFCRIGGCGASDFDGVIAVNADVLNGLLAISGPLTVYGKTFTSEDGALKLEEAVERAYLGDDIPAESKEHRKDIMKQLAAQLSDEVITVENIPKLIVFAREQLENKNVMLNFDDEQLQQITANVHWDGAVAQDWQGDYLYLVDANLGALKTDYYIKRAIRYEVDLTLEKPTATLIYTYSHTATHGDWRTSDYHSYLRTYVPQGSTLLERVMVGYPSVQDEFGKTSFGTKVDVIIGQTLEAKLVYELPDRFKIEPYTLLIQKQSGTGNIPVSITVHTSEGELHQEGALTKDLKYVFESTGAGE